MSWMACNLNKLEIAHCHLRSSLWLFYVAAAIKIIWCICGFWNWKCLLCCAKLADHITYRFLSVLSLWLDPDILNWLYFILFWRKKVRRVSWMWILRLRPCWKWLEKAARAKVCGSPWRRRKMMMMRAKGATVTQKTFTFICFKWWWCFLDKILFPFFFSPLNLPHCLGQSLNLELV